MSCLGRVFAILLVTLLALSNLLLFKPASAQSIPKPSVPEFSVSLADHSYDVPPKEISTTNSYNNQTTTTTIPGYHVQKDTIDLTIKNQPYPSSINGNKSYLLFYVRQRGHYGGNWTYPYDHAINSYPRQSDSDYTVLSLPTSYRVATPYGENMQYLKAGDEIDFQVMAILAYGYNYSLSAVIPLYSYNYESVAASDWSSTQTFTIPEPSSSPAPTESQPTLISNAISADSSLVLVAAAVSVLVVISLMLYVRHLKKSTAKPDNSVI